MVNSQFAIDLCDNHKTTKTAIFNFSQKDYVCFDFVPRHHNIIRFRRGLAVIKDDFSTVCSWVQFPNREEWKYDMLLCKSQVVESSTNFHSDSNSNFVKCFYSNS